MGRRTEARVGTLARPGVGWGRKVRAQKPFHIDAWVVLPDHMHCGWTLPEDDTDFSARWQAIKAGFSRCVAIGEQRSDSRVERHERGIWQRRFWEHTIRDDRDYVAHLDYVHFNPVKHGLVTQVGAWPHSSFHLCVAKGLYPAAWNREGVEVAEAGERMLRLDER